MSDQYFRLPKLIDGQDHDALSIETVETFTQNFNKIQNDSASAKAYLALCMTAEQSHTTPEHIAKILVDLGLRARKCAFPRGFVRYIEKYKYTPETTDQKNYLNTAQQALAFFWDTPPIQVHIFGEHPTTAPTPPETRQKPRRRTVSSPSSRR